MIGFSERRSGRGSGIGGEGVTCGCGRTLIICRER